MKTELKRVLVLILCGALALGGGAGLTALAAPSNSAGSGPEPSEPVPAGDSDPSAVSEGATKDETVYVLAGADGAVEKLIVSDWLKNPGRAAAIADRSELSGIETVKGDASWTADGDSLTWDAGGEDIYYQGGIDKDLPVEMKVTYTLDGKQVTPEELAGRSGRVSIRFDYTNRAVETVTIDGEREQIFVPFAVLTGVVLDNEVFTNVEVTNGKLINDGDRTAVAGVAFPGLRESLGLEEETLELPEYVEITADAEDFALETTITIATNEPFRELETDDLDAFDGLSGSMDEMIDAMAQLMDGAAQLYDGLSELADRSGALADGVGQLQTGAAQLSGGLDALTANNAALNGGAEEVFNTLLSAANTQLSAAGLEVPALTVDNYASVLSGVISSLDGDAVYQQALTQVTAAVEEQRPYIQEQVTAAVREQVAEQVIAAAVQMDKPSYDAAVAAGLVDQTAQAAVEAAIAQQMESGEVGELIGSNTEAQVQKAIADHMASEEVQAQLAAAAEGAQSVAGLKASLDSYSAFYTGLKSYTAGVDQAASGADALSAGADELGSAVPALIDGIGQLKDGAGELSDGLAQFNEEAVQKLADAFEGNLDGLAPRLRAVKDAAEGYQSFAGLGAGMDGQVKFVFRTQAI